MSLSDISWNKVARRVPGAKAIKQTGEDAWKTLKTLTGRNADALKVDEPMKRFNPVRLTTQPFGSTSGKVHPILRTKNPEPGSFGDKVNRAGRVPAYAAWDFLNTPVGRTAGKVGAGATGYAGVNMYQDIGENSAQQMQDNMMADYGYTFDDAQKASMAQTIDEHKWPLMKQMIWPRVRNIWGGNDTPLKNQEYQQAVMMGTIGRDWANQAWNNDHQVPFGVGMSDAYQKYGAPGVVGGEGIRQALNWGLRSADHRDANDFQISDAAPIARYLNTMLPEHGLSGSFRDKLTEVDPENYDALSRFGNLVNQGAARSLETEWTKRGLDPVQLQAAGGRLRMLFQML